MKLRHPVGPDVFLLSPGDFLRYYNGGALADLTPHLDPAVRADFLPQVLQTRLVDDRVYGLPMEIEPLALYYSETAFEQAGLAEGDLPRTWDDLSRRRCWRPSRRSWSSSSASAGWSLP
ncbi:ABC transporter substrate-binding protein [Saccharopolyspora sp. ASAGF58]|uniref:ABC transporter substrate-binding protein n=1 Tax=Saccharopolyspora sp. ASAGF58 TaxID=2719023 RepID=UPI001FF0AED9|nr:extracellular solute-binding protein [Saccharopolyspora sp. ASAGF58]